MKYFLGFIGLILLLLISDAINPDSAITSLLIFIVGGIIIITLALVLGGIIKSTFF